MGRTYKDKRDYPQYGKDRISKKQRERFNYHQEMMLDDEDSMIAEYIHNMHNQEAQDESQRQ
jgi:hypothetical protein